MDGEQKPEVMPQVPKSSQHDMILARAEQEATEFMNPKAWQMMKTISETFIQSGALPKGIDTFPKLMMVLQAGREAGMQPLQAINSFYLVNGKVSMYGEQCINQVVKAGHEVEFTNCNEETATCKITRKDTGKSLESTFTMQMAKDRGLTAKGGPWKSAPDNMLKFKAFHSIAKFIVPDALNGIEMAEIVETEYTIMPAEKPESIADQQRKKIEVSPDQPKSLEDALNEPEPEKEEPKNKPERPCCGGKTKHLKKCPEAKEVPTDSTPTEEEEKEEPSSIKKTLQENAEKGKQQFHSETNEQKYNRLTREMTDRPIDPEEVAFLDNYPNLEPTAPAIDPKQAGLV